MTRLPTAGDVERAAAGLGDRTHRTPLLSSATLGELAGAAVFLKAELLQRTGSFKPRGVFTRLDALSPGERRRGVIATSAGNHAQALAYACRREGIDCLVVMSRGASKTKVAATQGYGAAVDLEAADPSEAFVRMEEITAETGRILVHPFDDPLVIAGQGTVGVELVEDLPGLGTVIVPAGGGGLVAGIAVAVRARRPGARIVAVEPAESSALGAALAAGKPVPVRPSSIADGLNAPFAGSLATRICRQLGVEHVTVSEEEIRDGFRFLYERAKLAAEPAGAAGVAALLAGKVGAAGSRPVAAVVSGGNVDPETASGILTRRED